MKAIVFIEHNA